MRWWRIWRRGGEVEEMAHLPGVVGLAAGAARERLRRRRAEEEREEQSVDDHERAMRRVSHPGVRWGGSRLTWIAGDWFWSKCNSPAAKYAFGPGVGALTCMGFVPQNVGFWAHSTPLPPCQTRPHGFLRIWRDRGPPVAGVGPTTRPRCRASNSLAMEKKSMLSWRRSRRGPLLLL